MAIRKEQPGAAKAAAAAGTAIGESQKAIREQAITAQKQSQQATLKAREASEQRAMQWEVDKMQFRSQQDFEQELRRNQFSYDRENRAQEWDIEKAEIASRMDFERDEKERQTRLDRIASSRAAIDRKVERGETSEDQVELLRFNLDQEELGVEIGSKRSFANRLPQGDGAEQRAAGRFEIATETEKRAKERFEERVPRATPTQESIRRKRVDDLGGGAYKDVPLEQAEEALGITNNTADPTPEELKRMGTETAYNRGKKLGYWN